MFTMQSKILDFLKSLPIDLGQGNHRRTTKGKLIALGMVPDGKQKTALDVGCREGDQTRWLESRGYTVTSIDIENCFDRCIVMDANQGLQFPDNSFDLIWCSEVIEHLNDPQFFRNECQRVLKPGGRLVLTTPNSAFWFYGVMKIFGLSAKKLQNPTHVHFFSIRDIRRIFPDAPMFGFFPYFAIRLSIRNPLAIGWLSPTFVILDQKKA